MADYNATDIMLGEFYMESTSKKGNSSDVFRKLALIGSYHISLSEVLKNLDIRSIYIYGFGEIGQILFRQIKDEIKIEAIIDKEKCKTKKLYDGIKIISPDSIPIDEVPIVVTPSAYAKEIIFQLMKQGVEKRRLWSFNVLLEVVLKFGKNTIVEKDFSKQFLITGANFENKGAQAMLFTAVSEIRKRYPNAIVWYLPNTNWKYYTEVIKDQYKMLFLLNGLYKYSEVYEIAHNLTAIVDVSGYALATHFKSARTIPLTQMAYDYNVPLYFMPQSFGPLGFSEEVHAELRRLLPTAKVIFAREQQGYDEMKQKYHLENIYLSWDLVLQNKGIDANYIYEEKPDLSKYSIEEKNAVAIIPNIHTYKWGKRDEVLRMYKGIIDCLLAQDKRVYIVCHSNDEEVSNDIYAMYPDNESVILYDKEFDCIGYSALVKSFQYIIASRYHAIVHAYKEHVPCIAIGWAEKYKELLGTFKQENYVFDVREEVDIEKLLDAIKRMNRNFENEKEVLKNVLPELQKENCFDVL